MKPYTLGIDTSCYTTSLALADHNGKLVYETRKMLDVKKGARGLRQSEGFFQHVMNLPALFEKVCQTIDPSQIGCIAVSTRPRNQDGSYMPVFTAGDQFAKSLSLALKVPLFTTTHQDGHIMASAYGSQFDYKQDHLSVHLSGGTSEILSSKWETKGEHGGFDIDIIGGTLDVSAGQLIDRIGVALDYDFPCGKYLDALCDKSTKILKFPVSVKKSYFNLSGAEAYGLKYIQAGEQATDISRGLFKVIMKSLEKAILHSVNEKQIFTVLMAGGVSSSAYMQKRLPQRLEKSGVNVIFSQAKYAADNAIGVAILGSVNRGDYNET